MPAFVFSGLIPTDYPFAKDAQGQNLGRVEPGDEREFGQAPDPWWVPADGEAPGSDEGGAGEPQPRDPEPEDPETGPGE